MYEIGGGCGGSGLNKVSIVDHRGALLGLVERFIHTPTKAGGVNSIKPQ